MRFPPDLERPLRKSQQERGIVALRENSSENQEEGQTSKSGVRPRRSPSKPVRPRLIRGRQKIQRSVGLRLRQAVFRQVFGFGHRIVGRRFSHVHRPEAGLGLIQKVRVDAEEGSRAGERR